MSPTLQIQIIELLQFINSYRSDLIDEKMEMKKQVI